MLPCAMLMKPLLKMINKNQLYQVLGVATDLDPYMAISQAIKITWEKHPVCWILLKYRENFYSFAFDKKKTFCVYSYMALIKLVGKTFAVCRKSTKATNIFSCVSFFDYSIMGIMNTGQN